MRYLYALQIVQPQNLPQANNNDVKILISDFFILLGAVSILMMVIAGIRYIFARGNAESTSKAKNMIQYSVMGLVMAALAESIVTYVLNRT